MPKQINVKLGFQADTKQAKTQIQDLQNSLDNLMSSSIKNGVTNGLDQQMVKAQQSVIKLKTALDNSLNADTGRLDLSKFNQQLNNSNLSLSELAKDMTSMGVDGQKAFLNLTNSIVTAQKPMIESNKLLDSMWTALKNTARWQLSSSILHGFVGALQGAYGYAQDLDKSLNSIRIVTGQSADQMAVLAENANKSAQALSTSTLAYTDAALIYYQQGLGDEEVQKRVETTLKMSNVTGESAEDVSSYMTAIWNNFAEGSDNLELFADKITALGAATASSSEEIANGLNQFAALGSSLGLSYDDATAALATVVAQTRQSASTVGNSFRTLFQRIESLKLGETLEDGVDLTKYSEALSKVGVQILDANGDLRDMHDVIMDLGSAWEELSKAQKNALAQTVGGVRNSNTLIAWMENFDKFRDNLGIVANAEGTLQKQADIYAESWEAARKRVQAAWQSIYQDLIDEKFFTGVLNNIEKIINGVDHLIDSLGGLPGVLSTIGALITTAFGPQLTSSLQNAQLQLTKILKPAGESRTYAEITADRMADEAIMAAMQNRKATNNTPGEDYIYSNLEQQLGLYKQIRNLRSSLNDEEIKYYQNLTKNTEQLAQQAQISRDYATQKSLQWSKSIYPLKTKMNEAIITDVDDSFYQKWNEIFSQNESSEYFKNFSNQIQSIDTSSYEKMRDGIAAVRDSLQSEMEAFNWTEQEIDKFIESCIMASEASQRAANADENLTNATKLLAAELRVEKAVKQEGISLDEAIAREVNAVTNSTEDSTVAIKENIEALKKQQYVQNLTQKQISARKGQITKYKNQIRDQEQDISNKQKQIADKKEERYNTVNEPSVVAQIDDEILKLEQEIDEINASITKKKENIKRLEGEIANATTEDQETTRKISEEEEKLLNLEKDRAEVARALNERFNKNKSEDNIPYWLTPQFSQDIMSLSQGIMQLTSGITIMQGVFENLSNPDLSGWDKFTKLITGMLSAIPMLTMAITRLTAAESINAVKTIAAGVANQFLGNSFKFAATGVKSAVAAYALLAGELAIVTGVVYGLVKAWQFLKSLTPEAKLEKANEVLEKQKIKVQEANSAYNTFISTLDEYKKTQEEIDELEGVEKSEAIHSANASILEAIKNTDNWAERIKDIKYDDNGLIILDEHLQDVLKKDLYRKQLLERQVELQDEINKLTAQNDADWTKAGFHLLAINEGEDPTKEVLDRFAENGMLTVQEIASFATEKNRTLLDEMFSDFEKESIDEIIRWAEVFNDVTGEQAERNNAYLQQSANAQASEKTRTETFARETLGSELNQYDEESQQKIIDTYINNLELSDQIAEDIALNGKTIEEAFKNAGIEVDNLNLKLKELDDDGLHHIDLKINADDFAQRTGSDKAVTEELTKEIAEMTKYIQSNIDTLEDFDKHLADCKSETEKLAYSILRFDDAIQDVSENYEDWMKTLKNKDIQSMGKVFNELRKSYANLLDLSDSNQLSESFLQDTENLKNMKAAIEGNEQAYNNLQAAAAKDLFINVYFVGDEELQNKAMALYNQLQNYWDVNQLKVGAFLDDTQLIEGLNQMINATATSAAQAEQLLMDAYGLDAEVEEITVPKEKRDEYVNAKATITHQTTKGVRSVGDGLEPETFDVPSISYDLKPVPIDLQGVDTVNVFRIKNAHKSAGGGVKFKQSTHGGGGVAPKSSGGKRGGGGGGSAKKKEVKEHVKDEDRYHDVKERIDDLNKATDRLNKTKERTYGKSKLKYINDEIEALEKQVKLTDEYIAEIKKYLALDLGNLKGIGMGAVFDENGMLTNYEQVLANITATYNKAIDEYNVSAQEEADKEILEKAQKTYEENKKILKQYEDTYNLLQEQIDNRIDQINAIYDAKLEKIDWQIKLQLDFDDKDRELLQWIFDNMGDGADRAADRIANLNEQMETFDQDWETYRKGIKEIFSNHGINLDFDNLNSDQLVLQLQEFMRNEQLASELTEKEAEQLRDYLSGLMTTYTSMKETADEVHEILSDAIDAMAEEFEKQSEKIEQAGNIMKHYASIVDLTGRKLLKLSSSELRKMSQQIVKNAQDALGAAKAQMEDWRDQMQEAQQLMLKYQLEGDEQSYKYWKEHFEQLEELYTDATENYYSAWEEALEAANDAFEKSIDLMKEDYENAFGDMDLTWMAEQFETQQELNELYLPDYKKYHELNASVRKLNKSLQDTNNTLIKGKMNDLLDEINAKMAAGVEISEYEAGIIERRIALLQAEAQLRDAQQAKSAVRMTRDNEGNFSYTYTADQDAIGDAQENYAEAVYDYQDYMVSMSNDLQSKWLEWNQYFAEREAEILAKYKEGTEEYNQAMAALAEERAAKLGWLTDQMGVLFDEQKRFRDDDWADIENIVQMKLLSDEDLITSFDRTVLSAITGYDTLTELMDAGELAWENMLAAGEEALQTWQDNCYAIYEEAGTTVDDFAAKTEEDMESVAENSQNAKNAIYDMVNNEENGMKKALEDAKQAAKDFDDKYGKYMTSIQNATQATVNALNDM